MMLILVVLALGFTRLIGLDWGFPFYFHPDENNIASAVSQLYCPSIFRPQSCLEPGFYAYGQIFLYLGKLVDLLVGNPNYSLRLLSVTSSLFSGVLFYHLIKKDFKSSKASIVGLYLFTACPVLIQLAHFGTTESFAIFLFICALLWRKRPLRLGFFVGVLMATKISHALLLIMPIIAFRFYRQSFRKLLMSLLTALITFLILTPHYWLNFDKFLNSMQYELAVANGSLPVFYTQQFADTLPIVFQMSAILPYAMGTLLIIMSLLGVMFMSGQKRTDIVFFLVILFLQASFTYVKWTRFMALAYPLLIYSALFSLKSLTSDFRKGFLFLAVVLIIQTIPTFMFLKVYLTPDTRLQANAWIENTIKSESIIITEGANVVDLPFNTSRYQVKSFFLYDLDKNPVLASKVFNTLEKADYVVVPSRRVFANYTCYLFKKEQIVNKPNCSLNRKYPKIAKYYRELFLTGKFQLLKTFSVLDDEYSEETFTVFDHPYVRIFKRRIN